MRVSLFLVALALITSAWPRHDTSPGPEGRRMSFHNRLLLNRAAVSGLTSIEVLVLAAPGGTADVAAVVARLGGRVDRSEEAIGYLRVHVPTDRLVELGESSAIDAYQISSFSRASWYRDGPPLLNAEMYRGFEVTPVGAATPDARHPGLPRLSTAESREAGYTADDDVGVGAWMASHPTFDGRGVTIAVIESALLSFANPVFRTARTLDGREVPKIAGILNTIPDSERDETRVVLETEVRASTSWARIGGRTWILPKPGAYRFGMLTLPAGENLVHQFGVLEDPGARDVWIDADGDASFQDETPLADVNERFDPRFLKLTRPAGTEIAFVMGRGRQPGTVHIYVGRGGHETMTVGVAAGGRTAESLAYGVAHNARVLLVRAHSTDHVLSAIIEGFIGAAQRPDVDVISSATGITMVPDTAADFTGLLFRRLIAVYGKPIVSAAGNTSLHLGGSFALADGWSVGGTLGPKSFGALHGGTPLDRLIVHPIGAAGPALDGAIKPDFLAPMERLAPALPWARGVEAVPRNEPVRSLPPGYQIGCCTSTSAPYAAGMTALLISGAKQSRIQYSVGSLGRAMMLSARFLPDFQSHQQGHGALDLEAAWRALSTDAEPPRITASAAIVHPLAQYAALGSIGRGILEVEGWTAGTKGSRLIELRRESGPREPRTYRVTWTGNDGTFATVPSVTLPLGEAVSMPVSVAPRTPGAHSALLNLHDESGSIAFRTQATIVASAHARPSTGSVVVTGRVGLMRNNTHYVHVPAGTDAVRFELEVFRGAVRPTILPAHGLFPGYYLHVHPANLRFAARGRYHVTLPNPAPGTWAIQLDGTSTWLRMSGDAVPGEAEDAEYAVTVRMLRGAIRADTSGPASVGLQLKNLGSAIREPVVEATAGFLTTHRAAFLPSGLPNIVTIPVPENAAALRLHLRSEDGNVPSELYLYDCTSGECFNYNIGFPAAGAQTLVVRKPRAGRWVAAVNAAPFPASPGRFVLDEIITSGLPARTASAIPRRPGALWRMPMDIPGSPAAGRGGVPVVLFELGDGAADREETAHPWNPPDTGFALRDRPVVLGTAVYVRR